MRHFRLAQLNVRAICFLPIPDSHILAILHRDHTGSLKIVASELTEDGDLEDASSIFREATVTEEYARALLPMPGIDTAEPGFLVLGGRSILFYELLIPKKSNKGKGKERSVGRSARKTADNSTTGASNPVVEPRSRKDWSLSDLSS